MNSISCPCCSKSFDVDPTFPIKIGDRFKCTCNKTLSIIKLTNPLTAEEVKAPKFTMIKEK